MRILLALALFAFPAYAEIQPSFRLETSAWNATHIVVADENYDVIASWKGDLTRRDRIAVPAGLPVIAGARVVLFLVQDGDRWLPANDAGEMEVSAAWIEGDEVFAFRQQFNPGPRELVSLRMTERELRRQVDDVLAVQARLPQLMRSRKPFLRIDSPEVRFAMIAAFGAAGPDGVPALRELLGDESLLDYHGNVMRSMAKAGGEAVGPDLTAVLQQELVLWKRVGPTLRLDWWNDGGPLTSHYGRMYDALAALQGIRYSGSREVVTALRDYWQSLPQLRGVGSNQIVEACDQLLGAL